MICYNQYSIFKALFLPSDDVGRVDELLELAPLDLDAAAVHEHPVRRRHDVRETANLAFADAEVTQIIKRRAAKFQLRTMNRIFGGILCAFGMIVFVRLFL